MMIIARTLALSCFLVMLCFPLFSGFRPGRDFLEELSDEILNDPKGAPLLLLGLPLLCASSILSLLVVREVSSSGKTRIRRQQTFSFGCLSINGDGDFDVYAAIFIFVPCAIYVVASISRHFQNQGVSLLTLSQHLSNVDEASTIVKRVGNTFGMVAMVLFPFFLVPVAKHGPIIKLFGWDPARVLRLHIWSGRLIVFASLAHGALHLFRWTNLLGEQMISFLLPPKQCWSFQQNEEGEDFDLNCQNMDTNCSCYKHFLYLTGTMGAVALLLLLVTSTNWVRRKCYSLFYMSHIILAPGFLLLVVLHYKRAMLYIAPSILYYFAASLPVLQERQSNPKGTAITSVESLGSSTNRCISLTFAATEETVAAFVPGMYVQVLVPSISTVSHPFTVNRVPGKNDQLRIIFRPSGSFTTTLADQLSAGKRPTIHIDGYHGSPERLTQLLQHETAVIMAGGIGITPYLSLMSAAVIAMAEQDDDENNDGVFMTRKLVLHWSCRDAELVRYCEKEYFEPLKNSLSRIRGCDIEINVHQTGPSNQEQDYSPVALAAPVEVSADLDCTAFKQSCLAPAQTLVGNIPNFLAHGGTAGAGLALLWFIYSRFPANKDIMQRALSPMVMIVVALSMSQLLVALQPCAQYITNNIISRDYVPQKSHKNERLQQHESSPLLLARTDTATDLTSMDSFDEEAQGDISLRYKVGRPDIDDILTREGDDSSSTGVFCCGPAAISEQIYAHAHARFSSQSGSSVRMKVYDETFLM